MTKIPAKKPEHLYNCMPRLHTICGIRFPPGVDMGPELSDAQWERLRHCKGVEKLMRNGTLRRDYVPAQPARPAKIAANLSVERDRDPAPLITGAQPDPSLQPVADEIAARPRRPVLDAPTPKGAEDKDADKKGRRK